MSSTMDTERTAPSPVIYALVREDVESKAHGTASWTIEIRALVARDLAAPDVLSHLRPEERTHPLALAYGSALDLAALARQAVLRAKPGTAARGLAWDTYEGALAIACGIRCALVMQPRGERP